jgi:hypothetical protein
MQALLLPTASNGSDPLASFRPHIGFCQMYTTVFPSLSVAAGPEPQPTLWRRLLRAARATGVIFTLAGASRSPAVSIYGRRRGRI